MKDKAAINGMEEDKEMDMYSKPCQFRKWQYRVLNAPEGQIIWELRIRNRLLKCTSYSGEATQRK